MNERLTFALCVLVAVAWAVNVVLSFVSPDYEPDPIINGAFTAVLGFALVKGKDRESP